MTREETVNLVYAVLVTFPSQYKDIDKATIEKMVSAWFMILGDYDYKVVQSGFKAYWTDYQCGTGYSCSGSIIRSRDVVISPAGIEGQYLPCRGTIRGIAATGSTSGRISINTQSDGTG